MTFGFYKEFYKKDPQIKPLKNNTKYPVLYQELQKTIKLHDPTFEFDCITVNKNVVTKPHKDIHNRGRSYILFLGDFLGGELVNEKGEVFGEPYIFYPFEGLIPHWNNPIKSGTKYSVIWFKRFM